MTKGELKDLWIIVLVLLITFIGSRAASIEENRECNQFHLIIDTEPVSFVPKSSYIVRLESNDVSLEYETFTLTSSAISNDTSASHQPMAGWFSLSPGDSSADFSADEMNTIVQAAESPNKKSAKVLWRAPDSQNCVLFKIDINYYNNQNCAQRIEKKLCAIPNNNLVQNRHPPMVMLPTDECCACSEAVYKIIFEGRWTNKTHPKDFPKTLELVHFSDITGCTHSPNYTVWAEGQLASGGMQDVATFGTGSLLTSEMLDKKQLRSLIKITGLWYPKYNGNSSSVMFKVDKNHNLLSLAGMLGPSPDWFTGVSRLNLCTQKCTWINSTVQDLYLYDGGVDSGVSYLSADVPTEPHEKIYRITAKFPEDPRSPFYTLRDTAEMKPVARIYLQLQNVVNKPCSEYMTKAHQVDNGDELKEACKTNRYSDWSPCSATCGVGWQARVRSYVNETRAELESCDVELLEKRTCIAPRGCPEIGSEDDPVMLPADLCATTNWTEWSECTASCGIGQMTRTRHYLKPDNNKQCTHIGIFDMKKCMQPPCKSTNSRQENNNDNCTVTEWSNWSMCTSSCGEGYRIRMRYLTCPPSLMQYCKDKVQLEEKLSCISTEGCIVDKEMASKICHLELARGSCRGKYPRWYYNSARKSCETFMYTGCRGNKNNFFTQDECIKACAGL